MTYIPLTEIIIRADVPEDEIHITRYSKTSINDLKALVSRYGIDMDKPFKAENFADNDYVIYRQRLK